MSDIERTDTDIVVSESQTEHRVALAADMAIVISKKTERRASGKLLFTWQFKVEIAGSGVWDISTNAPNGFEIETLRRKIALGRGLKQKSLVLDWLKSQTQLNL